VGGGGKRKRDRNPFLERKKIILNANLEETNTEREHVREGKMIVHGKISRSKNPALISAHLGEHKIILYIGESVNAVQVSRIQ